ncbi:hypothetical protein ABIF81_001380 [Bradyrhizobium daqingense]
MPTIKASDVTKFQLSKRHHDPHCRSIPHRAADMRRPRLRQRPIRGQHLHIDGAEGLPPDRQAQRPRRQHHAGVSGQDWSRRADAEDDLREIVSIGRTRKQAAKEPAANVWFAPFNSSETTVE